MSRPHDPTAADKSAAPTSPPADTTGGPPPADALPRFGPPAAPNELGTLGRYRVLRLLGKGGMGAVYKAHDPRLNRDVALKVMLPGAAGSSVARERFLREARSAARVQHDHVIGIIDADEAAGTPYIAMPYLKGYPLDEYLKKKGRPPLPQVLRLVREMADGLAAAHALGIVHRDVKPGNVWLEAPHGRVKLLDFGLAKPTGEGAPEDTDLTRSGALLGTPAYMAPEQGAGHPADHRADLFSLGCVFYRLLADRPPFARPTIMATLTALAVEAAPPVQQLNPEVPPAVAELVDELLRKNPADRPKSAAAVVERIRQIERGGVKPSQSGRLPAVAAAPLEVTAAPTSVFEEFADGPADSLHRSAVREPAGGRGLLIGAAVAGGLLVAALVGFLAFGPGKKDDPIEKADETAERRGKTTPPSKPPAPKPPKPAGPIVTDADIRPVPAVAPKGPFDELDPAAIPAADRYDWLPKDTVAVLGSARGYVGHIGATPFLVSPDGRWVVQGWSVAVLDAATLRPAVTDPRIAFGTAALSPDGKTAAVGYDVGGGTGARLIDLSGPVPKPLRTVAPRHESGTTGLAFLPDGKTLATSTANGGVYLWDLDGPADTPKVTVFAVHSHARPAAQLSVSTDGQRLAAVAMTNPAPGQETFAALVWDISGPAPKEVARIPLETFDRVTAALAPDGRTLAVTRIPVQAGPAPLEVWDVSGPTPVMTSTVSGLSNPVIVGFAADGSLVCRHAVYALKDGTLTKLRDLPERVLGASRDLSKLVRHDLTGRRVDVLDGTGKVLAAAGSSAGEHGPVLGPGRLFTVTGGPAFWEPKGGALAPRPLPDPVGPAAAVRGVHSFPRFNAGGGLLAAKGADARVYVYAADDPPREVMSAPDAVTGRVAGYGWLPDGGLAVRTEDGVLARYDPATPGIPGKVLSDGADGPAGLFVVHPSGRLFAWIDGDGGLTLFRPGDASGRPDVRTIPPPAGEERYRYAEFTPDGRHLLACNGKLRRFDLTKPEPAEEVRLSGGCFWFYQSPDGTRLGIDGLTGGRPSVTVREAGTLAVVAEVRVPGYQGFQFAPDGRHLLLTAGGCTAVVRVK